MNESKYCCCYCQQELFLNLTSIFSYFFSFTQQDITLKTVLLLAIFAAVDIAASAGFVMVRIIMVFILFELIDRFPFVWNEINPFVYSIWCVIIIFLVTWEYPYIHWNIINYRLMLHFVYAVWRYLFIFINSSIFTFITFQIILNSVRYRCHRYIRICDCNIFNIITCIFGHLCRIILSKSS